MPPTGLTGLDSVDELAELESPNAVDYCTAAAQYVREASTIGPSKGKAAQIRLSAGLARATVAALRSNGLELTHVVAGERTVGGGLRSVKADVSEIAEINGLKLAVEIKPVHLAVGRAIWNRFGDIRTIESTPQHQKIVRDPRSCPLSIRPKPSSATTEDYQSRTSLVFRVALRAFQSSTI